MAGQVITVALAGQPNVGKSTVFTLLTGLSQYVSNWPGKTCEHRCGLYRHGDAQMHIVDLPGTYSLTANSPEERDARDFLLRERPEVVAVIADASALERNLYLVAELLYLPVPIVLGLNMTDVAQQQGLRVEAHVLEAALGLPVVPMVATRNEGVRELMDAALRAARGETGEHNRPEIREDHRAVLEELLRLLAGRMPAGYPDDWVALKVLEGDEEITALVREGLDDDMWQAVHMLLMEHEDAVLAVAGGRYDWIGRMVRAAVVRPRAGQIQLTDRLDRWATHPLWGLGILLAVLALLFWLTYTVGIPLEEILDAALVQAGSEAVRSGLAGAPAWLSGVLADGIIAGAGTVLTLLPILLVFFTMLAFLDDVGYMARGAYVMDRFMHLIGLHGRSFLPLFLGFGCNVPAVMGCRIVESRKARLQTILLAPIVPCSARTAVVAMLAPIFFGAAATWVSWGLVVLSLVVVAAVGFALHELLLGGEHNAFIMELPLYHAPNLRTIALSVWQRLWDFIKGAGTIIVAVSIILWALSTFPGGDIESSYMGLTGRWLGPAGSLLGLPWPMIVALLASFVRKENTIPTLAVLYGAGQEGMGLAAALSGVLTPAAALSFLVVQVLFIPCIATVAAIRQETRSWGWTGLSVGLMLVVSFGVGLAVYQGARFLGLGL
jgi:ferrous iron transport protein B